jgi:hypothetical protein
MAARKAPLENRPANLAVAPFLLMNPLNFDFRTSDLVRHTYAVGLMAQIHSSFRAGGSKDKTQPDLPFATG